MNITDAKKLNIDQEGRPVRLEMTHLSLDGAGGGVFSVPWDKNIMFLEAFLETLRAFKAS